MVLIIKVLDNIFLQSIKIDLAYLKMDKYAWQSD